MPIVCMYVHACLCICSTSVCAGDVCVVVYVIIVVLLPCEGGAWNPRLSRATRDERGTGETQSVSTLSNCSLYVPVHRGKN